MESIITISMVDTEMLHQHSLGLAFRALLSYASLFSVDCEQKLSRRSCRRGDEGENTNSISDPNHGIHNHNIHG